MRKEPIKQGWAYRIRNTVNGKCYIGASTEVKRRWNRHKRDLISGKHHSRLLQLDYNIFGCDSFVYELLEQCNPNKEVLTILEQKYIDELLPVYNICKFANSTKGKKDTDKTIERKRRVAIENNYRPPSWTWEEKRKKVAMVKDGEVVKEFESTSDAIRYMGKDKTFASSISRAIKRNIKCYGYHWKYL